MELAATPSKQSRMTEANIEYFAQPGIHWCPWNANSCSRQLPIRGQGTIAFMELEAMPFEILISNQLDLKDPAAFYIFLSVNTNEVRIGTSTRTYDQSTVSHHTLQSTNGKWHQYWLSYSALTHTVRYGLGEIRSLFTIFQTTLDAEDARKMGYICFLHIKIDNNDEMLKDLSDSREKFRFFVGKDVVEEPALLVLPYGEVNIFQVNGCQAIDSSSLEKPCRMLYESAWNFELDTTDFPDFSKAIAQSVKSKNGWCYKKLVEKANRFGRPNFHATYLRITMGEKDGTAPGHAFVVEVWPPGHYSPVHSHSNAYGIIKVLSGRILVKIYPELTLNVRQHAPIETILEKGQVTWMLPKINQVHQVRNPDIYGNASVTIQCYQYGEEDDEHYEYFDYLNNDGQAIGQFDPVSDIDFLEFKRLMQMEWAQNSQT